MLSFHNQPEIKKKYINRVKLHAKMDEIVKGEYWEDGKGCAVGCTIHSPDHKAYETELGIPYAVARLEDIIFEQLPNKYAMEWPLEFLKNVPVGVDLSMVWPKYTLWVLSDKDYGVLQYVSDETRPSVVAVIKLFARWVSGDKPTANEFSIARRNAASASASASASAASASASASAASASAYAYDAKNKFWIAASKKLIQLLKESGEINNENNPI